METMLLKITGGKEDQAIYERAAAILKRGGLVAFPTETVYGLGANGLDKEACRKIYEAKGRPSDNPLILHIADREALKQIVTEIPEQAQRVMDAFWPGPITLIFKKAACVPMEITGGFDTVAVRFPSHNAAQEVIRRAGLPIAAPSANSSGKPSPTKAEHVLHDLYGKVELIIDGGHAKVGLESTILDTTGRVPMILRPGAVTEEMLTKLLGRVEVDPAVLNKPSKDLKPKAPGMKYTHYSPEATVILVRGEQVQVCQYINQRLEEAAAKGIKAGVLATEETKSQYHKGSVLSLGSEGAVETIGANLFAALRQCDAIGLSLVYAQTVLEKGEGAAIMNRLKKAAGYQMVDV